MTTSNLGRIAVVSQGDWVAGTYKALDIVRYNGAAYIAKVGTSTVPTNTSYWSLLVNDGTVNYTWIKYADDINGTGLSDSPTGKVAIGIAVNKTTATESTTASDYAWSLLGGGSSGGGLLPTAIKTSSYTAAKNELVRCNTTAGAFSISMPASPSDGDIVGIVDIYNTFTTNKLTILPNGGTIEGDATSLVLDISGTYVSFVYNSVTTNWRLLETPSAAATGSGTVTSVSVVSTNGFSGIVATASSTPTITITTSVTGILKGNGTAISAAVAGDFPTLNQNTTGTAANVTGTVAIANGGTGATTLAGAGILTASANNTLTGTQTFNGTSTTLAAVLTNAAETTTVSATAATGTIAFYTSSQSVLYYTSNASANWTLNLTHSAGTTLNTAMAVGQTITVTHMVTNGSTAFYNNVVQVDGTVTGVTTKWQGGTAPTSGNASSIDVYTYAIIKTAVSTFTVLAAISKFA